MPSQTELRRQITNQIIAALEQGDLPPWRRPWSVSRNTGFPANVISKKPYRGSVNSLLLELHARKHGFNSKWWGTFQQFQEMGGRIQKRPTEVEPGQWGCKVVFFKPVTKTTVDPDTGETDEERFPMMRQYTLFNAEQTNLQDYHAGEPENHGEADFNYQPAEELIAATEADIRFGGDRAFYIRPVPDGSWPNHREGDYIQMPPRERYNLVGSFYETALHELAHWSEVRTGWNHKERGYPLGELAAEIAACYLATELGVPQGEGMENHAAYIESWIKDMKDDPKYIFVASTQASKVTDYLLSFVREPAEAEPVGTVQAA